MELKTTDQIKDYLNSKKIPFDKITGLPGGTGSSLWKVESAGQPDSIIKHTESYVKVNTTLPSPQERMDFEVKLIRLLNNTPGLKATSPYAPLPALLKADENRIALPTISYYDQERHVLQMKYAGSRTLKQAYRDPSLDPLVWGTWIGTWLANFHRLTRSVIIGKTEGANTYRFAYQRLKKTLEDWGFDGWLGARINDKYGAMLDTDDEVVCHGDFRPGKLVVSEDLSKFTVVDWEMVIRGCGALDVGQFAAEAHLLDFFQGNRALTIGFLQAYTTNADMTKVVTTEFAARVAIHFGTYLSFWPTRVAWGSREQTLTIVQLSVEVLTRVEAQDWRWFDDSPLREIFINIGR